MPPLLVESAPHATRGADLMAAKAAVAPDRKFRRSEQHNVDASKRACMASSLLPSSLQRIKCEAEVEKHLRLLNPPCELHATSIGPGNAPSIVDWKECTGRWWVSSSSRPRNGEQRDEVGMSPCSCFFFPPIRNESNQARRKQCQPNQRNSAQPRYPLLAIGLTIAVRLGAEGTNECS